VLLYASIAALSALPGGFIHWSTRRGGDRWIGWAHAVAAGGMLGAAFVLTAVPAPAAGVVALGGVLGVTFIRATHSLTGLESLDLSHPRLEDPTAGRRLVLLHVLHACTEGVAIGVAMAVDLSLGVFVALAIAVHNVPEAAVLSGAARPARAGPAGAASLGVLSNAGQPVLALASWYAVTTVPASLPWVLGFAVGALLNLVMTELLPASYREAGTTSIALVASVALGLIVLLGGALP